MQGYQIQRHPRSQHVKIKISPRGEVVVVAPRDCPAFFIDQFVRKHQDWIDKHVKEVKSKVEAKKEAEQFLLVFGKKYRKQVEFQSAHKLGVHIQSETAIIVPVSNTATSIDRTVEQFLKSTAGKYIVPRTHQLGKIMNISFKHITLRQQKTRWGSCSSEGNLNFNWQLVHHPPEVIDYVIIHELAHRREMNHSRNFWDIVRHYDPEYLKHRGWLKRQGMGLD